MLHWMYNTKPNQEVSKQELMEKFNIAPLENMSNAAVAGSTGADPSKSPAPKGLVDPRRPGMKLRGDRKAWQLMDANPQDRSSWRHRLCEAKNRPTPRVENET